VHRREFGDKADTSVVNRALGTPLDWPEAKKNANHVRQWGVEQLLAIWNRAKGKERDALLWGDEVGNSLAYWVWAVGGCTNADW
jgi:hypothetical protein